MATLAFFSDLLRTSEAGQPLVGEGAPARFARAYTSSSQSLVARAAFSLVEHAHGQGRRRLLALLGASAAALTGVGVALARLAQRQAAA